MEFLQSYWIWILVGIGAVWFLARRGGHGMGCGAGVHGGHDSTITEGGDSRGATAGRSQAHVGHGAGAHGAAAQGGRHRHGCC